MHGLAYLGVLLLFVGAFGLVAFAFGGVEPLWRPVAEVAIVTVPFAAATLLLRRGAVVAGRALELAGGLLLPVMVITAFLDDVPPDLDGTALVVVLSTATLLVAAGYLWWCRRHPPSVLRFLIAPVLWLAAGVAAMGLGREVPSGSAVASLTAAQTTAMAVALAGTVWLARRHAASALSSAALRSAVPGAVVVSMMAVLTWVAEDMPAPAILLTGVTGLVVLALLDGVTPTRVVAVAQPLWWAVTALALSASVDPGPAAAVAAVGFVGLLEAQGRRTPAPAPMALSTLGAAVAVGVATGQPWWGLGVAAGAGAWAFVRRLRPFAVPWADLFLDVAAVVLPALAVVELAAATENPSLGVLAGAGLVLLSSWPARRSRPRRDGDDRWWLLAWPAGGLVVAAGLAVVLGGSPAASQTWQAAAAAAVLAAGAGIGPIHPSLLRPWVVLGLGAWSWVLACAAADTGADARGGGLAVVAFLVVVVATASTRGQSMARGSLGLAGHVLAVLAPWATGGGWALVLAVAAATAGFAVTSIVDLDDRSPVGELLAADEGWLRYLPPVLTALGLPVTVGLALIQPELAMPRSWVLVGVLAASALGYAAASHLPVPRRTQVSLVGVGCTAAVLAPAVATDRPTAALGLGVLVLSTVILPSTLRPAVMVWLSWAAAAPLGGLLLLAATSDVSRTTAAAAALVGVGGGLAVVGLTVDRYGRPWVPRWRPARPVVVPPVVVGVAEVLAGVLLAVVMLPAAAAGWLTLWVAGVVIAVAALTRVGALSGLAVASAWVSVALLAPDALMERPGVGLAAASLVLLCAQAATRWDRAPWWARWDVSLLAAAHLLAASAVVASLDGDQRSLVVALTGVLGVAVATGCRANRSVALTYAMAGSALILLGALDAGPGWTSAALGAAAALLARAATRAREPALRRRLLVAGAVSAALSWQQATVWFGWAVQPVVDRTAVGAAAVALGCALVGAARPGVRDWAATWGSVASLVVAGAAAASMAGVAGQPSWAVVVGLGMLALAWAVAGQATGSAPVHDGAVALVAATEAAAFMVSTAGPSSQVAVLAVTAGAGASLALLGRVVRVLRAWQKPALWLAVVAAACSVLPAAQQLPDRALLVVALLVGAMVSASAGVVLRSVWPSVLAPVLACGAWAAFASQALGENPQWYTIPMGLALLVIVGQLRHDARLRGGDPSSRGIVVLELVGIAFLVGAAFVQSVTQSLAYVAVALSIGAAVAGWGMLTRVRRRVAAGAVVVLAAVIVLLLVPLVSLLPAWQGTGLWLFLLAAGIVALLAATMLEKGRTLVHTVLDRYADLGEDWE